MEVCMVVIVDGKYDRRNLIVNSDMLIDGNVHAAQMCTG